MARTTKEVVNHHLEAFGARDLSAILEDYTDESVFVMPDGTVLRGKQQMVPVMEQMFGQFGKPGASFSMGQFVIEGDIGYITWSAETADNVYEFGSETYLIRDGKIAAQTAAMVIKPKS